MLAVKKSLEASNTPETTIRLIEGAKSQILQYAGSYEVTWNLATFDDSVWIVQTPASRQREDGSWAGSDIIDWNVLLPDRSKLTDEINRPMLLAVKKTLVLISIYSNAHPISHSPNIIGDLIVITKWMYLNKKKYRPNIYGFSLLDEHAVRSFMSLYVLGGYGSVLDYYGSLLRELAKHVPEFILTPTVLCAPYNLDKRDVKHIVIWLKANGFYSKISNRFFPDSSTLSRNRIAELIGVDVETIMGDKFNAFLRQFEPDILRINSTLLVSGYSDTNEHWSHNTPLIADVISTPLGVASVATTMVVWEHLFSLHRHLPNFLPNSTGVKISSVRKKIMESASGSKKTPWIPLPVALKYTNEALRIVCNYGRSLTDFYTKSIKYFSENNLFETDSDTSSGTKAKKREERNKWVLENIPSDLAILNISGWRSNYHMCAIKIKSFDRTWDNFRKKPSLPDLITILIGATILLTSIMKPMRTGEIILLKRDCLLFKEGDGYYLKQIQEKRGSHNIRLSEIRPIPKIVAEALTQLREISDALKSASEEKDPYSLNALMYFCPTNRSVTFKPTSVTDTYIIQCMDRFCDWINEEPDKYGRRWYYRIHEGRKSFLITFFWCFKFSSLGAASWMAGHRSWSETLTYIKSSFPGDELPEFEAQYAAEQLWQYDHSGQSEATNVKNLYRAVCKHFEVNQINIVPARDLKEWLKQAFKNDIYSIVPLIVENQADDSTIEVAFKIKQDIINEKH